MMNADQTNLALLIDWENIKSSSENALKVRPDILAIKKLARRYGVISVARAYANWSDRWHEGDASRLAAQGIDPVFVLTKRYRPEAKDGQPQIVANLADVRLACDGVELITTHPRIDAFVVVSGDWSLESAIDKLAAAGKRVVRLAVRDSLSRGLYVAREEVVYYDDLLTGIKVAANDPKLAPALENFRTAVMILRQKKGAHDLKAVKVTMRTLMVDFDEEKLGVPTFRHLAYIAEAQGLARIDATHGEPADAYSDDETATASGGRLHSGQKWRMFISALDPSTAYLRRQLEALVLTKGIYTERKDIDALIDSAIRSEIIWARDRSYWAETEGQSKRTREYIVNAQHPRVQVACLASA